MYFLKIFSQCNKILKKTIYKNKAITVDDLTEIGKLTYKIIVKETKQNDKKKKTFSGINFPF